MSTSTTAQPMNASLVRPERCSASGSGSSPAAFPGPRSSRRRGVRAGGVRRLRVRRAASRCEDHQRRDHDLGHGQHGGLGDVRHRAHDVRTRARGPRGADCTGRLARRHRSRCPIGDAVAMSSPDAAPTQRIVRLVGVYDADSTLRGELAYWVGARLGRRHCSLCDITHGSVRQRPEWKTCRAELPVPFDTFHRNDQPDPGPSRRRRTGAGRHGRDRRRSRRAARRRGPRGAVKVLSIGSSKRSKLRRTPPRPDMGGCVNPVHPTAASRPAGRRDTRGR